MNTELAVRMTATDADGDRRSDSKGAVPSTAKARSPGTSEWLQRPEATAHTTKTRNTSVWTPRR